MTVEKTVAARKVTKPATDATPPKPRPRAAAKKAVKQTELSVSYSIGTKVNIGNYESVDVHMSRSEKFDTTDMTAPEIDKLWHERYQELHNELGDLVISEKEEILGGGD
jgi:hypothetical protein